MHARGRSRSRPHVHVVMPAAAIDPNKRLWRTKKGQDRHRTGYLFNHKALAKVFRGKLLEAIAQAGLALPDRYDPQGGGGAETAGSGFLSPKMGGGRQIRRPRRQSAGLSRTLSL